MKKNKAEKLISKLFTIHGNRIQFNIMDLPKIFNAARLAYDVSGGDESAVEVALKGAIAKFRTSA